MGVKVINVFLLIAVSACLIHAVAGKPNPRDSSVVEEQSLGPIHNEDLEVKVKPETTTTPEPRIPGRVSCDFEEANEDAVCQEHCLPKGYTYGICVSHTCSCI
uniref:Defensin n=2 Tax=Spodoptera frugiperda TaxID=7108 RepID=Q7Z0G6_SPOFR|nr:defensin precursor [Spodoptera frugiperda]AAQ18895.1 spodoptericin [Spodoptera frugiperda]